MIELWLEFENAEAKTENLPVEGASFVIGRHSDCDLSIPESIISRQHAKIDRFGDVWVISDCGSSFGTKLNGAELSEPVGLKDGDTIELGGSINISVKIISSEPAPAETEPQISTAAAPAEVSSGNSIPTSFFYLAPIFGLLILICAGGGIFIAISGGESGRDTVREVESTDRTEEGADRTEKEDSAGTTTSSETKTKTDDASPAPGESLQTNGETNSSPTTTPPQAPVETPRGVERTSAAFLRKIVKNDPNAFLTGKQIALLTPKIDQLKTSSAVAANLKNAKSNAAQIASAASNSSLTPHFLAVAAIAKLGNQPGNVADTAKSMIDTLEKLSRSIGAENADESLLVIAAYDQGVEGKFTQLRNSAEALSGKTQGVSARQVRTIWFLKEQNKLTDAEFDFALRFIAIGTIAQNPAEFGVNAEALTF